MEIAKKICIQMLIQRHWIVDEHKSSNIDDIIDIDHSSGDPAIDYFTGMTAPLLVNTEITKEPEHYIVFMLSGVKLNIANVKECIKILDQVKSKYCIIIYNNNITSSAKRVLNNFIDVVFEMFTVNELQYNISDHILVPKHICLNPTEQAVFIAKMGIDIPILHKTDPVCRFYNFQKGSIIKVLRRDKSVSYRFVK